MLPLRKGLVFRCLNFKFERLFRISNFAVSVCFCLSLSSCGTLWTSKKQYAGMDRLLADGDFSAAAAQIKHNKRTRYQAKDRALYYLDIGMLEHYLGDFKKSNESLETAEQAMEEARVKSVSRAAASVMLNDNALVYSGEDYENIYVNIFKALNYIALNKTDDAFVEIRRIDEKLKVLQDYYWKIAQQYNESKQTDEPFAPKKSRFLDSALGRWLSLFLYRAENNRDDARIDLEKIREAWALQPDIYNFSPPDLTDALKQPAANHVKVSFLGFTGQAPEKRADTLWIHTQENRIFISASEEGRYGGQNLSRVTTFHWPGITAGYTFKFQMPYIEKRKSRVTEVRVKIDGKSGPQFGRIESLENAAKETFEIQKPLIYLKTITRTVVKGIAAEQVRKDAEKKWGESGGLLAGLLAGAAVGVTENADLRISRFFPAEACIAETELRPGKHQIEFEYYGSGGTLLHTDRIGTIDVHKNKPNLVESAYLN
jgi:hypothetical protein